MGNNLAEQQVNNNNNKAKTKQQTQEQLSSPLSQVLKTYDFGNFENCELNSQIICSIIDFHSHLYHICVEICTEKASLLLSLYVPLVHSDPDPIIAERDLPLQMETHWQCGGLLYPFNSWV